MVIGSSHVIVRERSDMGAVYPRRRDEGAPESRAPRPDLRQFKEMAQPTASDSVCAVPLPRRTSVKKPLSCPKPKK